MKFELLGTSLILLSFILFLIINFPLWSAVTGKIAVYIQNLINSAEARATNRLNKAYNY